MSLFRIPRILFISTTSLTHGFQGMQSHLVSFYRVWSKIYDMTVCLDVAYRREMRNMIGKVVSPGKRVLDLGAGTGLGTIYAAGIAERVMAIDLSPSMLAKLRRKSERKGMTNIEVIVGSFPEDLPVNLRFDAIFSSFAIVHWPLDARGQLYQDMFSLLKPGGRIGLFSARGEVAAAFEMRAELEANLERAGFAEIEVTDLADIYRSTTACCPAAEFTEPNLRPNNGCAAG